MKTILIMLILSPVLFSQDRLTTFIEQAMDNNPELAAKENRFLAKQQQAIFHGTLPDPMFSFTQWVDPVETRVGPQQNIFSLSQKVPFPGKLSLKERITSAEAESDEWLYTAAKRDLAFTIKISWYELYLTDQSLKILNEYMFLLRDFTNAAAAKYATGQGIQAQVLKAQVEFSTIKARIQELQRNRFSVQSRLNQLRNRPADDEIAGVTVIDSVVVKLPPSEELFEKFKQRPEYKASLTKQQQAQWQQDYAEKEWLPDFTIQANYITVADKNTMVTDAGKDAWGIVLGLNLPLWFAGRSAQIEQSHKNVLMRREQSDGLMNQIRNNIADLRFKAESTGETILLYNNVLLPQAENSFASALAAYRSGNLNFLELLDAERMLLQLRLAQLKEQVSYRKIIAGLEREVGGEL